MMSTTQNFLVTLSLLGWLGLIIFELIRKKKEYRTAFVIQIILMLLIAYGLHRYFGYFNTIEVKGGVAIGEGWTLGGLYLFTVLGILGQHVFVQIKGLNETERQRKFKWLPVLKPLVVSPLIFLAVLNQLNKMGVQANTLTAVVTQCILAFQNGFFWKTVIEQFEKKVKEQ